MHCAYAYVVASTRTCTQELRFHRTARRVAKHPMIAPVAKVTRPPVASLDEEVEALLKVDS